jgi:hypothetical protein
LVAAASSDGEQNRQAQQQFPQGDITLTVQEHSESTET